jgi:hypothetical protein
MGTYDTRGGYPISPQVEDYPDVALHVSRRVKAARKDHVCSACTSDPILKGQPYTRVSAVVDGVFQMARFHYPMCPAMARDEQRQWEQDVKLFNPAPADVG